MDQIVANKKGFQNLNVLKPFSIYVEMTGLEPATSRPPDEYSTS